MNKIDWYFWIVCIGSIICLLLMFIFAVSGCTTIRSIIFGPTIGQQSEPIIPASPAAQMWEVVAKTDWVVTICLLGFGAGLFTFFNGKPKLGLAVIASCIGTLFFGLAIHRFPTWMAVLGLVGSVAGAAASILMKHRALIEIIKGGQVFKQNETDGVAESFVEKQKQEQSPTTQKLVKKIKSDLKLRGEI